MILLPRLMMKLQGIQYGKRCVFKGMPIIVKEKQASICLGNGIRIRSSVFSNLIGLYQRTIIVAKEKALIEIDDDVGMSGVTIYAREHIKIGKKCLIGANVKILDNDFHPIEAEVRRQTPGQFIPSAPVSIGDNVFIGCNALVLKGVTIGDNAVIGAGSVVSRDIPANCIAAGNPACVIRKIDSGINEKREEG